MATRSAATQLFLGFTGVLFAGYGLVCLAAPETVANLTGMQLSTGTATVEVRAMYGGLQTAVGLLALLAVARESLRTPILLCIAVIFFGLVSGRLVGIAIDPEPGSYNFFAAGYEAASAAVAFALLPRRTAASQRAGVPGSGLRAFVALPLTPIVRERLAQAVSQLRTQTWSEALRWAPAENLHLTLRFLGEVAETSVPGLLDRLRLRLEALDGFHCGFAGLFLFPHASRPRVVAARLSSEPRLPELARAVEEALVEEGFEREPRVFRAHITLARFPRPDRALKQPRGAKTKAGRPQAEMEAMKSALAAPIACPELEVREVVLYQSVPGQEGVRYHALGSAELAMAAGGPDRATRR